LESIYLKSLNAQELERTRKEIARLEGVQAEQTKELHNASVEMELMVDTAQQRGTSSKTSTTNLFLDDGEYDGIEVWNGDEKEEEEIEEENN
jgi:hypothetical protein